MKKWLWVSFFLSLFLSITLIYTMVQNKQLETSFYKRVSVVNGHLIF